MSDQLQLLLKASESLSELYSHDFYPPPHSMNTSFPSALGANCDHASHKWEKKSFQLLFNRELERSEWDQERTRLSKENDKLKWQVEEMNASLVRLNQDVLRVQESFLLMNASINHGYEQLKSSYISLEEKINKIKQKKQPQNSQRENTLLLEKLKELKSWSELLLKDD